MFAELYELKHFKGIEAGTWVIEAFMEGYGSISRELAFRTAVHVGTHLICWGSRVQGWGGTDAVEGVVRKGRGLVEMGWKEDEEGLKEAGWGCLFSQRCE